MMLAEALRFDVAQRPPLPPMRDKVPTLPHDSAEYAPLQTDPDAEMLQERALDLHVPPLAPVKAGDVLGEKYRVEHVLGKGGMGVVVAARHIDLGTRVAIKFLLPAFVENPEQVVRFIHEARSCVQLRGEHTVKVYDVGKLSDGAPYIVMELLTGRDLERVLDEQGPLPVAEAVGYVLQACEGLAEAHALGMVHRDLKPQNLFMTTRVDGAPLIKILDFGLARSVPQADGEGAQRLTSSTAIMGSPMYMSPEQLRGFKNAAAASDQWSLGVCLFELLTARVPFPAESVPELCAAVLTQPALRMRSLRAEIPEELDAVVARCLEKDPQARFADVAALAAALEPFASGSQRASISVASILTSSGRCESDRPPPSAATERAVAEAPPAEEAEIASTGPVVDVPRKRRAGRTLATAGVLGGLVVVAALALCARGAPVRVAPQMATIIAAEMAPLLPLSGPSLPPTDATATATQPAAAAVASPAPSVSVAVVRRAAPVAHVVPPPRRSTRALSPRAPAAWGLAVAPPP
jgi:eukaryotic-like serine/threonine-protein kinase